jgi:hypothetical protein
VSIYAVNGKTPVAAWIPSRDTAGNGTTTLTDLVGSNNGTLTNMDAATDWVADTGAGGVRALDFDGVNDNVSIPDSLVHKPEIVSVSCWAFARNTSAGLIVFKGNTRDTFFEAYAISSFGSQFYAVVSNSSGVQTIVAPTRTLNTWHHLILVFARPTLSMFYNGSLFGSATHDYPIDYNTTPLTIGKTTRVSASVFPFNGRIDDIRIFNTALTADDAAYLYNNGNGRGRINSITPRRRRDQAIYEGSSL